jgi:glycosyltransferase involved in cell wall biosynthesis
MNEAKKQKGPLSLWIFTENRNATYCINFEYPLRQLVRSGKLKLLSWSAADLVPRTWDEIHHDLQQRLASTAERPDAVILSRLVRPYGPQLLELFAQAQIPSHFHLDDLLFEVPADLGPHYSAVYDEAYRSVLQDCVASAGTVLASTDTLAAALQLRLPGKPIRTLAGVCYLPGLVQPWHPLRIARRMKQRWKKRGRLVIGYMGSNSHARDLATATPQILSLLRSDPRLNFETLGLPMPEELLDLGPERVRAFGYTNSYSEFLGRLHELDWDIGLAPLVDDAFNRSKTVTKFVEYTSCGVPVIASAMTPYGELASATQALDIAEPHAWADTLKKYLGDPSLRRATLRKAEALCEAKFAETMAGQHLLRQVFG